MSRVDSGLTGALHGCKEVMKVQHLEVAGTRQVYATNGTKMQINKERV